MKKAQTVSPWRRYGDEKPKHGQQCWVKLLNRKHPVIVEFGDITPYGNPWWWNAGWTSGINCRPSHLWAPCEPPPL